MDNTNTSLKIKWAYTALITLIIWFALVLQFSISIPAYMNQGRSLINTLVQLFSFYTILCNLLMVVCLSVILISPKSAWGRFFSKVNVLTGIAFYITVVGLIYNLMLRQLSQLESWPQLANELLHVINPILFIVYWLTFVPKGGLKLKNVLPWLWFPFVYFVYVLIRGAISGDYPYPFLNTAKLGYPKVLLTSLILLPLFWALGALFIWIAQLLNKKGEAITAPEF